MGIERVGGGASARERSRPAGGEQRAPAWVVLTMALLTVGWLAAASSALGPVLDLWSLFGEAPTTAELEQAQRQVLIATGPAVVCPALAWLLALRRRRSTAELVFAVGALLSLLGGVLLYGLVAPERTAPPVRDDGPSICQERSGGDNDCPGG